MKDLMDLLKKKSASGEKMSDSEKKAKMGVLGELRDMMRSKMGEDLDGMKKVTVASDSKEGLKRGLEKAEELMDSKEMMPMKDSMDESEENMDSEEDYEDKESMDEDKESEMSLEEVDDMLEYLKKYKENR